MNGSHKNGHNDHHAHTIADFQGRFWISIVITVPILIFSPMIVVFVIIDGNVAGAVALADIIRPESKEAISRLREIGIKCMMLTGDNKKVAKWVSDEIGLDEYFAVV